MKTRVMVFGTFDIFHPGHRSFLKQARKFGDYLIVVVARDKTVAMIKKQKPENKEAVRVKIIKNSKLADKVILGSLTDKYSAIKKYRSDVICLGYDQKFFVDSLREELKKASLPKTKIIRLKSYKPGIYKSSKLKRFSEVRPQKR
jgi:FAD synthetase